MATVRDRHVSSGRLEFISDCDHTVSVSHRGLKASLKSARQAEAESVFASGI